MPQAYEDLGLLFSPEVESGFKQRLRVFEYSFRKVPEGTQFESGLDSDGGGDLNIVSETCQKKVYTQFESGNVCVLWLADLPCV